MYVLPHCSFSLIGFESWNNSDSYYTCEVRCEALVSQKDENTRQDLQREVEELRLQHTKLKVYCIDQSVLIFGILGHLFSTQILMTCVIVGRA